VILSEDLPLNQAIIQHNDYAVTKWVNEVQVMNFENRFGTPIVRLRFFNAYGPGEYYHNYRSVVCLFGYRALHGLAYEVFLGYHRVFMYIDDFIPTLANVANNFQAGEVYNIGDDEFRSVKDMSDLILETVGEAGYRKGTPRIRSQPDTHTRRGYSTNAGVDEVGLQLDNPWDNDTRRAWIADPADCQNGMRNID